MSHDLRSVIYGSDKFVAAGFYGFGYYGYLSSILYSTDGVFWDEAAVGPFQFWNSIAYGDGKFVVVGQYNSDAAYSTDGITWTQNKLPDAGVGGPFIQFIDNWRSVTYSNGKFVAVASGTSIAAYSTNGITWTKATMPNQTQWESVASGEFQLEKTILL